MIDLLDRFLTLLFATRLARWIAVHVLHIPAEKCSLCYTRVRFAQFMLRLTGKLDRVGWIHDKRVLWKVRAHPIPEGFKLAQLTAVASAQPAANVEIPTHYLNLPYWENNGHLWWPRTTSEQSELESRRQHAER